jgi:hypothetical protein
MTQSSEDELREHHHCPGVSLLDKVKDGAQEIL